MVKVYIPLEFLTEVKLNKEYENVEYLKLYAVMNCALFFRNE